LSGNTKPRCDPGCDSGQGATWDRRPPWKEWEGLPNPLLQPGWLPRKQSSGPLLPSPVLWNGEVGRGQPPKREAERDAGAVDISRAGGLWPKARPTEKLCLSVTQQPNSTHPPGGGAQKQAGGSDS
jgi:hypothetical protein